MEPGSLANWLEGTTAAEHNALACETAGKLRKHGGGTRGQIFSEMEGRRRVAVVVARCAVESVKLE